MDRKVGFGRIPFDIFSLSKKIGRRGGGIDLPLNPRVCSILTPVGWSGLHCCLSATRSHGFQILFSVSVTRQPRSGLITNPSVDFSQQRIRVKQWVFFYKNTIKVCVSCLSWSPGTSLRIACYTKLCPCVSEVPEPTHLWRLRPLKGALSAQNFQRSETQMRELLVGTEENGCHWFALKANLNFVW